MEKYMIAALIAAAIYVTMKVVKSQFLNKLQSAIKEEEYQEFFTLVDSGAAQILLPGFIREILKLSAFMKQGDCFKTEKQFQTMEEMQMSPAQKCDFLIVGFHYFKKKKEKDKCWEIIEKMKKIMPEDHITQYQEAI